MSLTTRFLDVEQLDQSISTPTEHVIDVVRRVSGPIMVIGAGGKMGYHLCLMLQRAIVECGRPERIIAVSRFESAEKRSEFDSAGLNVISADASKAGDVARLPDAEAVFFLAGVKFGTTGQPELLRRMNVDMPRLVAERFQQSRIVALSTGCVYSFTTPASGGASEQDAVNPPGEYAVSCLGREQAFTDLSCQFGTPVSLIRLNYSVETRYGVLVDVAVKVLRGEPVDVTMGYVNVIWQGDALMHIVQSLPLAGSPPRVFNVTGAETLRVRDIAESFARRFNKPVRIQGTEAPTAWLNNAKLSHRLFGSPRVSVEQMQDWIADWLLHGMPLLGKPTHFEVRTGGY